MRGLLVSVFTNATLVTDEIAETFVDCPPWAVEVSLYGVTAATHDSITGMPSSHARCMRGIELLLGRGVKVKLKTVLMMLNRHELTGMKALARRLGVKFRFDPGIFPRFSGDRGPLALRVPPEEAVDREMEDDEQRATWRAYFEKRKYLPVSDRVYSCGAGLTHFHIDPNGTLQPCSMTPHVSYPLSGDDFAEGWDGIIPALREKRTGEAYLCNRCDKRVLCGFCPAFSRLENDSEVLRSEYLCAIGQLRFKAIEQGAPAATSYGAF
jgi:radical SAM protein with 4Fe4S-binding SPASM domain